MVELADTLDSKSGPNGYGFKSHHLYQDIEGDIVESENTKIVLTDSDICVMCGCYVPEGTMVCNNCPKQILKSNQ